MQPQQSRVKAVFDRTVEIESLEERRAYLDKACRGDPELRDRVDALLRAYEAAGSFLEKPAAGGGVGRGMEATLGYRPISEGPGAVIGAYKLLQQIGEGGFGVVYMAEQQEPVRRKVALKIIKPGMDTKEVIARFESERQALALMDHPNIARVLDAGATDSGRPYFVMELVKGVPITEYCDRNNLPGESRLKLFVTVCHAVQHAHQKGVIHRDIKPTNIMVTLHDGVPVPKVIDFGVAKATSQQLTARTLFTQYGQMIGTPAYMSPEQAEMSGLDIDTRSDIYSLGVLLYELLTGSTPFDAKRLLTAGYAEMQRIIREEEPPRPSLRFSTMADSAVVSSQRGTDAKRLAQLLRGDLDVIVMKSLEKDRNRRYDSPNSFAQDVERFLRREPVWARAPSAAYRFRKFVERNRAVVGAVSAVAVSLWVGIVATTWLAMRENAQRVRAERLAEVAQEQRRLADAARADAERERDRAVASRAEAEAARKEEAKQRARAQAERDINRAVTNFLEQDLIGRVDPGAAARPALDPNISFREFLELIGGPQIEEGFKDQPLVEAALRQLVGHMFRAFAEYESAELHLAKCLEIRRRELGDDHPDTLTAMTNLAALHEDRRQFDKAEPLFAAALDGRRRTLGDDHVDTLSSLNNLAAVYHAQRLFDKAEPLYIETLDRRRRVLGNDHDSTFRSMLNLANLHGDRGQLDKAEPLWKEILDLQRRMLGDDDPRTLTTMNFLGVLYVDLRRYGEAKQIFQQAMDSRLRVLGADHSDTLLTIHNLAATYQEAGEFAKAEPLFVRVIQHRRRLLGDDAPLTVGTIDQLLNLYDVWGRYEEAEAMYRLRHEVYARKYPVDSIELALAKAQLGYCLYQRGKYAEAEPLLRDALAVRQEREPGRWTTANTRSLLGGCLLELGRELAQSDLSAASQRFSAAEPLLIAGYEGLKARERSIPNPSRVDQALRRLVQLYDAWRRPDKGVVWRSERDQMFGGFVRQWLVAAPIPFDGRDGQAALDEQQFAGEANLRPRVGDGIELGDRRLDWRKHEHDDYFIDFRSLCVDQPTHHSIAYAVAYVVSDADRDDLVLHIGSDDQSKLYLNGRELFRNSTGRVLVRDQDRVSHVALHRGTNVLVFKVVNQSGGWQGCVRLSDGMDRPAEGLEVRLDP